MAPQPTFYPQPQGGVEAKLAEILRESGQYRVLRKHDRTYTYAEDDGSDKFTGAFVDVETTGLDLQNDRIIEMAAVTFTYGQDEKLFSVLDEYQGFEDPGVPIPAEVVRITGITDEQVAGQRLDDQRVEALLGKVNLVIAHNAAFDRPFLERRFPFFAEKPWGCSMHDVEWEEAGVECAKLKWIAHELGFDFDSHRAINDCFAGIEILANCLPASDRGILAELLGNARQPTVRIWAKGAPFAAKEALKRRGYRWNPGDDGRHKAWYIDLKPGDVEQELGYLEAAIFEQPVQLPTTEIDATSRFSLRV